MRPSKINSIIRTRFHFSGIVQGVGFRPFIFRIASRHELSGFVQNRTDGVTAEVEGASSSIENFIHDVKNELPPLTEIISLTRHDVPPTGAVEFSIVASDASGQINTLITPDIATCDECLKELFDPQDRRFHYPFINCTNCGPRLTIIKDIPYDRKNTSMACFELCEKCQREYENPLDRRFHAEPNACPVCGPRLRLLDETGNEISSDPIKDMARLIRNDYVIAIKGIGGFHLCVDAMSDKALTKLRSRKFREEKPLAIMVKDLDKARSLAEISDNEASLLSSPARPIVLVEKKSSKLSSLVAPGMSRLGLILPYAPLHHLLFEHGFDALVMTSANQTDEPICTANRETLERLKGIADYFLVNNRDILVHCDDSIAFEAAEKARIIRRSRGYAPRPVMLDRNYHDVLAMGPHMKSTICILKGNAAYLSPHIGDMETPQARDFYHQSIHLMQQMTECYPSIIACDLHPGYYSTKIAKSFGKKLHMIQHHHAHIVSCMAENNLSEKVIGIALDGTGYGDDSTIWGGELLISDRKSYIRAGHLDTFMLTGSEKAVKEPWRTGVSLLKKAYGNEWSSYAQKLKLIPAGISIDILDKMMDSGINSPITSSMGRLFDGIAALTGLRLKTSFEGQAAMELEAASYSGSGCPYELNLMQKNNVILFDTAYFVRKITDDILSGISPSNMGFRFHAAIASAFSKAASIISEKYGLQKVVLSGGCFQNRLLLENMMADLVKNGLKVYHHRLVPTNDGGVSLGQAVCAAEQEI